MTLELRSLGFGHGEGLIGNDVTLTLARGEILALLGANGAGKTTLFRTILGLLPVRAGDVILDGQPLSDWSRSDRAKRIAYVPQAHAALFPFIAADVVLMGRTVYLAPFSAPSSRDKDIAHQALEGLGIAHLANRPYTEISGGERQLVLIARALAQQPSILVMDEPTASLDYGHQTRLLMHIRQLASRGISVILSTHNPDHVFMVADRVALLHEGRLAGLGPTADILTPQALKQLYGIDVVVGSVAGSPARLCAPILKPSAKGDTHGS